MNTRTSMRRFILIRHADASGVSGTGIVAEGVEFASGRVALTWLSQYGTVNVYDNIKVVEALHGHDGMTTVEWVDPQPSKKVCQ